MRKIVESNDGNGVSNGMRQREGEVGELKLFEPLAHRAIRDALLIVLNPKQEPSGLNVVYPLLPRAASVHIWHAQRVLGLCWKYVLPQLFFVRLDEGKSLGQGIAHHGPAKG